MNYLLLVCQLLLGHFLISCGSSEIEATSSRELVASRSLWFSSNKARFTHLGADGETPLHPFFDFRPEIDREKLMINAVVVTEEKSEAEYKFDLYSGKIHYEKNYCQQEDVWKRYDAPIDRPPYSIGFVPRLLDQQALPQKILVFGKVDYSNRTPKELPVRVVGGVIAQYCQDSSCSKMSLWNSRFILIAVNPADSEMEDVTSIGTLKEVVNWEEVLAHIENGEGRTIIADREVAYVRVIGLGAHKHAIKKALKVGHLFSLKTMKAMQTSCSKIYDELLKIKKGKDHSELRKIMYKNRKTLPVCYKYVQSSNINNSSTDHWYMALIKSFYLAEELGHYYDCKTKSWFRNHAVNNNKRMFDVWKRLRGCKKRSFLGAFDSAVKTIDRLSHSSKESYRYIQYDYGILGSKEKVYSWVKDSGKLLACQKKTKIPLSLQERKLFPKDVFWHQVFK